MKQPLSDYIAQNFTRPPTPKTARKWCERGELPAQKIGGSWYVIVNEDAPQKNKVNSLVDKVLNG